MQDLKRLRAGSIGRRAFTESMLLAVLGGVTVSVTGCSSTASPSAPTTPQPPGSRTGSVSANHGHTAVITNAQLTQSRDIALDIRGAADHPHTVVITMAELGTIAGGQRVSKSSSVDASASAGTHSHTVIFN